MSKTLKMFLSAMMIVTLTVIIYYTIAALGGGLDVLVQKAFGGALSALTIIGLLAGLGAFGRYLYWLSEHHARDKANSGGHAVIGVIILVVAAVVGIRWVQWGWGLFWLLPLLVPAVGGAWAITVIARRTFARRTSRPRSVVDPPTLEDLLA